MRFPLVLLSLFALNGVTSFPLNSSNSRTRQCQKPPVNNCNCQCTVNQNTVHLTDAMRSMEAKMDNLITLVNNISSNPQPAKKPALVSTSCKEQYERDNSSKSQVFPLKFGLLTVPVYCHMGDFGCGGGGWTLAMKTDGTKRTFEYKSHLWTSKNEYNLAGGKTGFDAQETKLPSYWETNFSKICLGMRIGNQTNFITINKQGSSLYSLIADGTYHATPLGRNYWKTLIGARASLQLNCNREGFNAACGRRNGTRDKVRVRIGILGNNENDCRTVDSRIGFGMQGVPWPNQINTCGNAARGGDNGTKRIKTFGYILVQ